MPKFSNLYSYLVSLVLIFIPLYPKFPLVGVSGTFVAIRLEDFVLATVFMIWLVTRLKTWHTLATLPMHRAIFLYLVVGLISLLSAILVTKSTIFGQGFLHWLRRIEYLLMFGVAYDFLKSLSQISFLTRIVILVSFLVALYGLGQQFLSLPVISTTNSEFSKGLALTLGPGARINSTFAGHYDLAAYSIFPLLLILGLLMTNTRHKVLLLPTGLLIYSTMLLSASRVTFAAFFVTAGLFILFMRRFLWLIPLVLIAILSILATPQLLGRYREFVVNHLFSYATPVLAQTVVPADEQTADALKPVAEDRSLNIRLKASWPRALRSLAKNPLLGTGYASIGLAADNDYLRSLAETGLLGFLAFGLIILRFLKTSLAYFSRPVKTLPEVFIIASTFSLIGLLFNAVFIDVFEASKIAIVTWTVLGLSEKIKTLIANHPPS